MAGMLWREVISTILCHCLGDRAETGRSRMNWAFVIAKNSARDGGRWDIGSGNKRILRELTAVFFDSPY
jgi:hypothetical protein